jgi:hypothetical protein
VECAQQIHLIQCNDNNDDIIFKTYLVDGILLTSNVLNFCSFIRCIKFIMVDMVFKSAAWVLILITIDPICKTMYLSFVHLFVCLYNVWYGRLFVCTMFGMVDG